MINGVLPLLTETVPIPSLWSCALSCRSHADWQLAIAEHCEKLGMKWKSHWIFRQVTEGHSRSLKMVPFWSLGTVSYAHCSILYHFRDKANYWSNTVRNNQNILQLLPLKIVYLLGSHCLDYQSTDYVWTGLQNFKQREVLKTSLAVAERPRDASCHWIFR